MRQSIARNVVSVERRPSHFWVSPSSSVNLPEDPSNFSGRPGATACGRSSRKARWSCGGECTRAQGHWLRQVVTGALLGADVARYSFIVVDLHHFSLPVSRRTRVKTQILPENGSSGKELRLGGIW